jgi:hypothetical protein
MEGKKPCRYCGFLFDPDVLYEHQVDCPMSPLTAGHDPDYDQDGRCRICGEFDAEG